MTRRVLVVDDDEDIRSVLTELLAHLGCQVQTAVDGAAALAVLRGGSCFDLVLLDLMMPKMNGYDFLARCAQHPVWRHLSVVVITAQASSLLDPPHGVRLLRKPFGVRELMKVLDRTMSAA